MDPGPREADWILAEAERRAETTDDRLALVTGAVEMASRRAAGEPLQYVLGSQGFRRLVLEVGPGVFIPRPETEQVAGRAMTLLPQRGLVVDLCTGSGAIALSILDERSDATVFATEMAADAIDYALRNAARLAAEEHRERFLQGDLFEPLPADIRGSIDVVVANPPYVAPSEAGSLPPDVVRHEPPIALFAEQEGLATIGRITREAAGWLAPGGALVLEIGEKHGNEVTRLLHDEGTYEGVVLERDLAGKQRIVLARTRSPWFPAAEELRAGGVAVVPTDTVYGLAAHVASAPARARIFDLKGRPREKALPVLVHNLEAATRLGLLPPAARTLAEHFWPGPLTLVIPRTPGFSVDLGGSDPDTIALRVPDHRDLLRLLSVTGPLAVTSANVSGAPAPATVEVARRTFPDLPVMPGRRGEGTESTVVSLVGEPTILRSGALPERVLWEALRR